MKYFVDVNIIIDLFLTRKPFVENAVLIFEAVKKINWTLYTSDNAITTSYFYLKKENGAVAAKKTIATFLRDIEIVPVSRAMLITASTSKINDFEDAVQFECAASIKGIDGIITRNKKDFKHSTIPVFAPEEVLF
ncbi:type II toxin-antitoxin system VapC family toxin [Nonlabens ponticola]|uniref:PIN domain-containing protein n=1 Tax=Nonlabens ponticola TaxID=2496866 RepID=A0A3S9MWP2_9FLAO|nr:PIN domain-containing protein [Nonlabens ponticola]AZQ43562.1 PIN domain-containing protein [Nonlabens ponticola]